MSCRKIAEQLKVSKTGINQIIRRFRTEGTIFRKAGSGEKRKTTENRFICRQVVSNPRISAKEIKELLKDIDVDISISTVKRRLNKREFNGRLAQNVPLISKRNIKKRLSYAKKYMDIPIQFWRRVIFSDESSFKLTSNRSQHV